MGISAGYVIAATIPDNKNPAVLVVGKQTNGKMDVINAFSGEEALQLLWKIIGKDESNRLMTKKE